MAKPFSIQSPENIAKEYGGNKQRIAQAMQLGIIDPTAGVLAGMFIDQMRGAQMQEGANPPTVAQQVMGGAPPAPPVPTPPAGGLGATPQAAPPMAPMTPPVPAPEGAPMGMADGGLVGIPVPETMFDEPDNGGYAGGGLVAFADGGGIDAERLRRALLMQESGGDYGITNREGSGAMGAYQFMPDTARALAQRAGLDYRPDLLAGKGGRSKKGIEYQERLMDEQMKDILAYAGGDVSRAGVYHFAGPNKKGHGPKTRQYGKDILRRYAGSKDDSGSYGIERAYTTTDPLEVPEAPALADILQQLGDYTGTRSGERTQAYLEAMEMTPERRKKMKQANEAAALAAAAKAFSGPGPFVGQIGTALSEASSALAKGKQDIRAAKLEGLKAGMTEEQQAYLDRLGILDPAARIRAAEVGVREAALGRKATSQEAERDRAARAAEAALNRDLQIALAKVRTANPTDFEQMLRIAQSGTPEEKAALLEVLKLKQQYAPSASSGVIPGIPAQGGASSGNELDFSQLK